MKSWMAKCLTEGIFLDAVYLHTELLYFGLDATNGASSEVEGRD